VKLLKSYRSHCKSPFNVVVVKTKKSCEMGHKMSVIVAIFNRVSTRNALQTRRAHYKMAHKGHLNDGTVGTCCVKECVLSRSIQVGLSQLTHLNK